MFIIRFCFFFSLSYLILAFPFNSRTVFEHIHDATYPATTRFYDSVIDKFNSFFKDSTRFSNGLFDNSLKKNGIDQIRSKSSSVMKTKKGSSKDKISLSSDKPEDNYTQEEKKLLKKILKEAPY